MIIPVSLNERSYDVVLESGILKKANEFIDLNRKVLIVTDSGVPKEYAETVAALSKEGFIFTVPKGEESKSIESFKDILSFMLEKSFSRKDCVVAVGGGVVGDLAGFSAACYMRGVDFYNIPTTVLSEIDSSVGGKTAVNLSGIKNPIGAFYQPKKVLIDFDTLKTLPERQISNGLAEGLKIAATFDKELFSLFEEKDPLLYLPRIIERAVNLKKEVVVKDERESGLRKVLNFGHTIGHGIESAGMEAGLYHGECVSVGLVAMTDGEVRERIKAALEKLGLPVSVSLSPKRIYEALLHDKKAENGFIDAVYVKEIGSFEIIKTEPDELYRRILSVTKESV